MSRLETTRFEDETVPARELDDALAEVDRLRQLLLQGVTLADDVLGRMKPRAGILIADVTACRMLAVWSQSATEQTPTQG